MTFSKSRIIRHLIGASILVLLISGVLRFVIRDASIMMTAEVVLFFVNLFLYPVILGIHYDRHAPTSTMNVLEHFVWMLGVSLMGGIMGHLATVVLHGPWGSLFTPVQLLPSLLHTMVLALLIFAHAAIIFTAVFLCHCFFSRKFLPLKLVVSSALIYVVYTYIFAGLWMTVLDPNLVLVFSGQQLGKLTHEITRSPAVLQVRVITLAALPLFMLAFYGVRHLTLRVSRRRQTA